MKILKFSIIIILVLAFTLPNTILARDFFLYDLETNKILVMGENDTQFIEKLSLNKNPNLIMKTFDPNKYLAIFTPGERKNDGQKTTKNNTEEIVAGQLVVINIATGRTEDLVELGYYPFRWTYSSDYKHFFVSYRPSLSSNTVELLHYDITNFKTEKIDGFAQNMVDLKISVDNSKIYAWITDKNEGSHILGLKYAPFEIINKFAPSEDPAEFFTLGSNRVAVIEKSPKHKEGLVQLINMDNNVILDEQIFKGGGLYDWNEEERVLILGIDRPKINSFGKIVGKGKFFRIDGDDIRSWEISKPWLTFTYVPERDLLYIILEKQLAIVSFDSEPLILETGRNYDQSGSTYYFYEYMALQDSDLGLIYCSYNGEIKFIDLTENKLLKTVRCGKKGRWALASFFGAEAKASITTNPEKTIFYVLNRATQDITVLDQDFNQVSVLTSPGKEEKLLGMYQVKDPVLQTLVTTKKGIYKMSPDNHKLDSIYTFKSETAHTYFYQDKKQLIFLSDDELLVFDSASLQLNNQFDLYADPEPTGTQSTQRKMKYHFIRTIQP